MVSRFGASLLRSLTLLTRRVGRIAYFFRYRGEELVHAHVSWFHHKQATTLGTHGHPRGLCYADHCDSIPATEIIRPLEVARVAAGCEIPAEGLYYE